MITVLALALAAPVQAQGQTQADPPGQTNAQTDAQAGGQADAQTGAQADAARTAAKLPKNSDVPSPAPVEQMKPAPPPAPVDAKALEPQAVPPDALDDVLLPGRRRPGAPRAALPEATPPENNPGAIRPPPPSAFPENNLPLPDRWRVASVLCPDPLYVALKAVCHSQRDPYHQNVLKGDVPIDRKKVPWLPIHEDDWFVQLGAISDTIIEPRSFPTPVGVQTTSRPNSQDVFGRASSLVLAQTFEFSAALLKGSTAFKPPEIEYRVTLAANINYAQVNERRILSVKPSAGTTRTDGFVGVQELFVDRHLRNVSDHYDFDSLRVGIQGFQADFRGFLFNDNEPGIRLFGNRNNNRWQYNLAFFARLEKDTNSGLNDITEPRRDYVFIANLYRQDLPVPGFTSQVIAAFNFNRERTDIEVDTNGFPVRPALLGDLRGRNYDAYYVGYNGDGHFGRLNLTVSTYGVFGQDRNNFFTGKPAAIQAFFAAAEPSYDLNWVRVRGSFLFQSGDSKPYDNKETGYDAIVENPVFAGADTSYWIRQTIPFAGGGRAIGINGRNGILANLRSSNSQGQSNFNNPGLMLAGGGADFDITPKARLTLNANHFWFQTTETLQALRVEGSIPKNIGWDLSAAATYRPRMTQNIVFRLSGAVLLPGKGFKDLFTQSGGDGHFYSVLANVIFAY